MKRLLLITIILGFNCGIPNNNSNLLSKIFQSMHSDFSKIVENPEEFRVQIIYTQIDRNNKQVPIFTSHMFNVNPEKYFYPASTVKFPAAVLALDKINHFESFGITKDSKLTIGSDRGWMESVDNDSSSETGNASIAHYIKKIFVVSDDNAFNRIYEFLGQDYFNERMWGIGYPDTRFRHRLSMRLSAEENKYTNSFDFFSDKGNRLFSQPSNYSGINLSLNSKENFIGDSYLLDGKKIDSQMDFSQKNYFNLIDQHRFLQQVIFPELFNKEDKLLLTDKPDYKQFSDGFCKFFMFGDRNDYIPSNIRIYNKVGMAYGFLIDNAYIIDTDSGVEFFLSAVIYVNSNGVLNDDDYEYDELGLPFLSVLGQKLYEYEISRERKIRPDFSRIIH